MKTIHLLFSVVLVCLSFSYANAQVPPNDTCGGAIVIACGDVVIDSTDFATSVDAVSPACQGGGVGITDPTLGVWYTFTGTGDSITLSTNNPGTTFDTELQVFRGSCDTLTCIGVMTMVERVFAQYSNFYPRRTPLTSSMWMGIHLPQAILN